MPCKILFVDDSRTMHHVMHITFARASTKPEMELEGVYDGEAFLQQAQAHKFDALIIDVSLRGMDGYTLCNRLRQLGVQTPVLLLCSENQPYDSTRGKALPHTSHLTKPFETGQLLQMIREMVVPEGTAHAPPPLPRAVAKSPAPRPTPPAATEFEGGVTEVHKSPPKVIYAPPPPAAKPPAAPAPVAESVDTEITEDVQAADTLISADKQAMLHEEPAAFSLSSEQTQPGATAGVAAAARQLHALDNKAERPQVQAAVEHLLQSVNQKLLRELISEQVERIVWEVVPQEAHRQVAEKINTLVKAKPE